MAETEGLEIEKEVITEPEPIMDEGPTGRWLDLKEELWEKLITIEDEKEEYELIRTSSSIDSPEDNQRAMITLDFIFYNLHFCKDKEMTFGQAKIIMKFIQKMYETCIFNQSEENVISKEQALEMFKNDLRNIIANLSDSVVELPSKLIKAFVEHFTFCFFRNYNAYQLTFNEFQDVTVEKIGVGVETPGHVPPTSEATGISEVTASDGSNSNTEVDASAE